MPSHQTTTLYRRSNGQPLAIRDDRMIGRGGEGHIYALDTLPDLVAKVYHRPRPRDPTAALKYAEKRAKLALMVDNPPNMPERDGHVSIAWPLDTLHSALPASVDNTVGFLMHNTGDMKSVVECFNPGRRKRHFPHYTYKHLCAVAINIAVAVDAVHDGNYVIGDINESNIMINDNGLVTLIDTDSFQVFDQSDGTIYRSPVGKPEYTPRELQGHSFDQVDRDVYHDRFGLGMIIYQLLMEGHHPYSGRYTGGAEPPAIEGNIARGHFLHCENRVVPLVDGPGYMRWETLDESIRNLFGLCFETGHDRRTVRPAPDMWEKTITQAVGSLAGCPQNDQHLHFIHNQVCPWCERRNMLRGRDPFPEFLGPEPPPPLLMRSAIAHGAAAGSGQLSPASQPQTQGATGNALLKSPPSPPPPLRPSPTPTSPTHVDTLAGVRKVVLLVLVAAPVIAILGTLLGFWSPPWDDPLPPAPSNLVAAPPPAAAAVPPPPITPTATPPATARPPEPATPLPALPAKVEITSTPSPTTLPSAAPAASALPTPTPEPSNPVPVPAAAAVETHFLADLVVEDKYIIFDPPNPSVDDTVIFTVSVLNQGEGDAGPSKLSYTVTRDAETILVGEVDVPAIPKGGSESVSFEWTADAGVHSFTIEADATDQVHETANIDNNKAQLHYNGTLLADLIVESIDWSPDTPVMGEAVTFSVTIRNQGEGRAGASTLELYVDDGLIGEAELPPILPGDSEMVSFTWDAQAGLHNLNALADSGMGISETDDDNNQLIVIYESTLFADLIVERISWDPLHPSVGDEVTFGVTVRNQGTLGAGESIVDLSRTSQDDAHSSSKGQVSGIPAGGSTATAFRWEAEPGAFTVTARANADGRIEESDEDNNEHTVDYDATALADLIVTGMVWKPERPVIGEEVTVTVTLNNAGDGDALVSDVQLYIDDVDHGEAAALPRLSANDSGTVSFNWIADMGMHTFSADVDHGDLVVESDETNNASETFEYDHTRLADLNVKEIDWEPDKPSVGDTVNFGVVIENLGEASARGFQVSFEEKFGAWQPMEETVSEELAAGQTVRVSFEWPADADPHQFVVVADSREEVIESNEDNNKHTVDYSATALADLIVADIAWEPERPSVGDIVTFGVLIENRSEASAQAFHVSFRDESGLSSPAEKTVSSRLAAGQTVKVYFEWAADADPHQFVAVADSREEVIESNEENNEHTVEYGATALADLIVADIAWEPNRPDIDDEVTVTVTLKNAGDGDALASEVRLFIDDNEHGEPSALSKLSANDSATVSFTWIAEVSMHTFSADVDHDGQVVESDETNNASEPFAYDHTMLADLTVVDIAWEPDRPVMGEEVTVTVTLENAGEGGALASEVRLFIDDKQHGAAATLPNLSSEDSDKVTFIWIAEVGMHTFSADVDHDNRVIESDETNNASEPFAYDHTRLADLIVREIAWEPEKPSVGDKVTFEAIIDNLGQASARGFHVSFGDRSSVWQPMVKIVSGELGAGQTTKVYFEWPADADRHQFVVVADSRGEVIESSEDNNELTVEYGATVVADLVVNSIKWNPARPALNESVTIEITVKNTGQGGSEGFIVSLAIDGTHYRKRQLDGLDVGQSVDVRFGWDAEAGPHRFTATADSEGRDRGDGRGQQHLER